MDKVVKMHNFIGKECENCKKKQKNKKRTYKNSFNLLL